MSLALSFDFKIKIFRHNRLFSSICCFLLGTKILFSHILVEKCYFYHEQVVIKDQNYITRWKSSDSNRKKNDTWENVNMTQPGYKFLSYMPYIIPIIYNYQSRFRKIKSYAFYGMIVWIIYLFLFVLAVFK